ncbi:hypothetical protein DYB35_013857 [Aphanomyces astaci]|uniref:HAT C-terminal dimerisation domain-containing protein n=1 Tax=Aphanomyces astaci TaxID=112090 RepID=A0A3R7A438_APHAT|nr:hypothetical protein DYB35_013857 [Aphanomyces astaci]
MLCPSYLKWTSKRSRNDVAMHFYITGTSFHRVGQFHLKRAFQRARPDIVLPNRQALANKYLDICYHEVKEETDRRLGAPDTQDIFGPGKTKWGGNDVPRYPNGYPFEHLANFVDSCKDVVRFIRNNGQLKSALSSLQKANHLGRLVMHAPTRLNLNESKYIVAAIEARWEFVYGDAHMVGYLLDPRFVDSGFDSMEFKEDVVDFVVNYPPSDTAPSTNSRRDALSRDLKEFQKYCLKLHSAKGWRLEELKSKKKTVAEFWMHDGQARPLLRELELRAFNLVASSAASERNFSMHGFIQSKKRNRLSPSTVTKLMYIKTNYTLDDELAVKITHRTSIQTLSKSLILK